MHFFQYAPSKKNAAPFRSVTNLKDGFPENNPDFYDEPYFRHLLQLERMRTERNHKPFLLLLIDISRLREECLPQEHPNKIKHALIPSLRVIDICGWYNMYSTIGIIFTEMPPKKDGFIDLFIQKMFDHSRKRIPSDWLRKIDLSCQLFPDTNEMALSNKTFNINLYPDFARHVQGRKMALAAKKIMDIAGSLFALLLFAPLLLAISTAVKVTSPGPVFFKQQRVGRNGKTFNMLKFRSMTNGCDPAKHQDYIKKLICEKEKAATEPGVFKLTHDSRITPVGHFLRRTSLDELPQFINVLKGDMSLVGPRPPIPYECELYEIWHRRRLFSCMPGITGLWQVSGRSRTTFDDMVRLDLKYIREWSLWMDIKILLRTPKAVLQGNGAL